MLRSKTSQWAATTALLCVALVAMSWLLLISPRRAEAAEIREQAASRRAQNDALQLKVAQLRAQFADLGKSRAELAEIQAQIPVDAAMPTLVRALDAAATSGGVTLLSVTPGAASTMQMPGPSQAKAATPAPSAGAAGGSAAGAAGSTAAGSTAAGATRVIQIPIVIESRGAFFQQVLFLKKIQTELTRVLAISNLQMAMDDKDAGTSASATPVTMTLTGRIFALPDMAASSTRSAAGTAAGGTGTSASGGTTATPPATSPATQPASEPANSVAPSGQTAAMPGESSVTRGGQLS
ncbi:MAG: hypothetical protein JNL54_01250 [Kineosporiaceae bacterium]|nr:hypothetical protein [Kineosporiaceae bacterium]